MGSIKNQAYFPCAVRLARGARNAGKLALLGACGFLLVSLHPQELRHVAGVVNVEVPVRVFDGERFVDGLTLKDFEVFENGKPQKIVALYLIRKATIQKEETSGPAAARPAPKTGRTIVLQFEVLDPMPKLDEALDFFFDQVLEPEDSLTVITPRATYRFKPEALARLPRQEIARQLKDKLRKDILAGAIEYKRLLGEIRDVGKMSVDPDLKLHLLADIARQLRDRIGIDPASLRRFAQALRALEGQKYVFLFYEKELINDASSSFGNFGDESLPPEERALGDMGAGEADRSPDVAPKSIERIFSDASITAHFIYLTQSKMNAAGLDAELQAGGGAPPTKDMSASLYNLFREMAHTTGGISESSGNPFSAFRKAVTASENYYLLYYSPAGYQADGKFREIKVAVTGRRFRVTNRAGYFAN
ncbi:MAG: VWA domain-containing protein [Candidatus Aminicenantales bacterium]|jgi:VWFA-related protein